MSFSKNQLQILIIISLCIVILHLPPATGLDSRSRLGLAVLVFAGGLWITEAIPLQVTSLLIPVSLTLSGLVDVRAAFAPFSDPVVFLILGSLFLAEALRKHQLTRRIAMDLLIRCRGNPRLVLLSIMLVAAFTSMWVFSTAVVAMLIPVCMAIASLVEKKHRQQFLQTLLMALVIASTLGALSTILGASSNAVAIGVLNRRETWSFLDWMKYGFPLALILLFVSWLLLIKTVYPTIVKLPAKKFSSELTRQGNLSRSQKNILYVLAAAIVFWVGSPIFMDYFPHTSGLAHSALISLIAAAFLFSGEIITWKDARQINWGVYLIIGAGLSLANGLQVSGVSDWFAVFINYLSKGLPYPLMAGGLILISAIASNIINNTTVVAIFAPLLVNSASGSNLPVSALILPMAFGATFGFFLPSASTRMALIYTTGEISTKQMIKIGAIVTIPLVVLTMLYFYFLSLTGWLY
ncbi:MAG: SLC13 family permease [bacterium]